jgi:hypothetical protein
VVCGERQVAIRSTFAYSLNTRIYKVFGIVLHRFLFYSLPQPDEPFALDILSGLLTNPSIPYYHLRGFTDEAADTHGPSWFLPSLAVQWTMRVGLLSAILASALCPPVTSLTRAPTRSFNCTSHPSDRLEEVETSTHLLY